MHWLIGRYRPTSLFSLKHGDATSSGGKSLLIPTPFAVRMALLDVAIRVEGADRGQEAFEFIKSLRLALSPAAYAAVTSTFVKVLKPEREKEERGRYFQRTIAFREFVHLQGELRLAFGATPEVLGRVKPWLSHLNYLGKRGSFLQLMAPPDIVACDGGSVPEGFVSLLEGEAGGRAAALALPYGMLQRLDDWGAEATFESVNTYEPDARIRLGRQRRRYDVVVPYTLLRSSRGLSLFGLAHSKG